MKFFHRSAPTRAAKRSRVLSGAAAALVVSLLPLSTPVDARTSDDRTSLRELQRQRDEVRRKATAQAGQVDALRGTDAEVSRALEALTANVNAQQDRVEEAERAAAQALADQEAAEAAQAEKQAELDELTGRMKDSAVEAYVRMGSNSDALSTLGSSDVNDAVNKRTLLSMRANENLDLIEKFRAVQEDLEIQRAAAVDAAERAKTHQAAVNERMAELEKAHSEQQAFAAQVEARLESALAEADSLAQLDKNLAADITSRQASIARAVAAQRAAEEARRAQRQAQNRPTVGGGGGRGGGSAPPIVGSGSIVSVGGIRVHQSIAGNVARLLQAAAADGVHLSGGGYRDSAGQIATRKNNCGTSHYAIYQMPASQCRPPTARPGASMHERGLAIDFTQNGRTLTRSSSGFAWLKANAASYGLYNLPSEPWHWSTNGN